MIVWHLVYAADSLTYTVAKALTFGGCDVSVWVVDREYERRTSGGIQRNLAATPRVRIVVRDESVLPRTIDRLIVQAFPRPAEALEDLALLARRARRITLISAGDRSRSWRTAMKLQWLELRRLALNTRKVDRVLYKDGFHRRDILALLARRRVVGFDVHSQFLRNDDLFQAMHARDWDPGAPRPILVNFLGCQDPESRKRILDSIRPLFRPPDGSAPSDASGKSMFWHEYTDASPVGLPPPEFVRRLTDSDFTLCPRGYSLVTHRPMEALLRGSIPVLDASELDLYGIELVDGENCVGVPEGRWPETVRRLAGMREPEIVRMRRRIAAMFADTLAYDAFAKSMRSRLGVAG